MTGWPQGAPAGCAFKLPKTLRLRSFAKINHGLKILRKRPDGYHELRTIYQTIGLHDRLAISLSKAGEGISVDCDNPAIPAGPGNLVYRTCEAWARARAWRGRIHVEIGKVIPLGSGLGGASTNAAVTILGLERLSGDRLDFPARHALAAGLGSDVPSVFARRPGSGLWPRGRGLSSQRSSFPRLPRHFPRIFGFHRGSLSPGRFAVDRAGRNL